MEEDPELVLNFDAKRKKRKKPGVSAAVGGETSEASKAAGSSSGSESQGFGYEYTELLDRLFDKLDEMYPGRLDHSAEHKLSIPAPLLMRQGTVRTVWANLADIAAALDRSIEHLKDYVLAELGLMGTLDSEHRLTVRARWQTKQIQTVIRHYCAEYVRCNGCAGM